MQDAGDLVGVAARYLIIGAALQPCLARARGTGTGTGTGVPHTPANVAEKLNPRL